MILFVKATGHSKRKDVQPLFREAIQDSAPGTLVVHSDWMKKNYHTQRKVAAECLLVVMPSEDRVKKSIGRLLHAAPSTPAGLRSLSQSVVGTVLQEGGNMCIFQQNNCVSNGLFGEKSCDSNTVC
ncbi:DNA ligase [Trichinella pseudospiralis]